MSEPTAPPGPPPSPSPAPATPDTTRYVDWMKARGTPIKDTAREDTSLRIGDWGFYDHGGGPGQFQDRAAVDKSGHAITPSDRGDWRVFLATSGLDPSGAHRRIAWLWHGGAIDPKTLLKVANKDKLAAPKLEVVNQTITFEGFMINPPNMNPSRITITATSQGAKVEFTPASKL